MTSVRFDSVAPILSVDDPSGNRLDFGEPVEGEEAGAE